MVNFKCTWTLYTSILTSAQSLGYVKLRTWSKHLFEAIFRVHLEMPQVNTTSNKSPSQRACFKLREANFSALKVITIVPSQRDVKCTSLVNVLGYIDFPCMLRSAPIQREVKSTRLVNAIWRGRYYCILKYALSRRDVKSTCVVEAFGEGVFIKQGLRLGLLIPTSRPATHKYMSPCIKNCLRSMWLWKYAPTQRTWLRWLTVYIEKCFKSSRR